MVKLLKSGRSGLTVTTALALLAGAKRPAAPMSPDTARAKAKLVRHMDEAFGKQMLILNWARLGSRALPALFA